MANKAAQQASARIALRINCKRMGSRRNGMQRECAAVPVPIWQELLVGVEMLCLRISPVYWGLGIPGGDGSAVVLVPCFLGTDIYLAEFRAWLNRIGYRSYPSGISWNAECPNLLIRHSLAETIDRAYRETRKKVHLVGHSLGGVIALSAASQAPDRIASVITMASPLGGVSAHSSILRAAEWVRLRIQERHAEKVMPACYTPACTCDFVEALDQKLPKRIAQTAIYSKADGVVDWKVCMTGNPEIDQEVSTTHLGMAFNPAVYKVVAHCLAGQRSKRG
jgi:hypothetical protein